MNQLFLYNGFVPPCGIYCGVCPVFVRDKNLCLGAETSCKTKKCKSIYVCCIDKKKLDYCYQCKTYPCSRFKKFANTWLKHGQDLYKNQELLKAKGKNHFLIVMNA
ncbi:DUF3795 domain-containing protein [Labilibacter marinus]|uniref:DUF3795 domain-containing protein n=1 Tax=Labilibacter marinus TaxID=1477105 RepID=UPI0008FF173B|nr:DUF3795 domain-containing protein [Labilibacter marinus]